jgi:hypothetical protein
VSRIPPPNTEKKNVCPKPEDAVASTANKASLGFSRMNAGAITNHPVSVFARIVTDTMGVAGLDPIRDGF